MHLSRRDWLALSAGAGSAVWMQEAAAQNSTSAVSPMQKGTSDLEEPPGPVRSPTKAILEKNQKDIKKDIEKLYDLASQLKAEVEKTDAREVLSMSVVKKAEEVEKLAKQIKEHARG
jgi:hypothetical protein